VVSDEVGCVVFRGKCPGTGFVSRREAGVVVMKGPDEAKLPVRVNSQRARRDPDT
jgi:hypothetical protein